MDINFPVIDGVAALDAPPRGTTLPLDELGRLNGFPSLPRNPLSRIYVEDISLARSNPVSHLRCPSPGSRMSVPRSKYLNQDEA